MEKNDDSRSPHAQRCLPKMQGIELRANLVDGMRLSGNNGGYSFGAALSTYTKNGDQIFQPLFTDGLFLAGLETFRGGTLIIMMNDLVPTRTALAEHHRAAHSAEQLGGEQIIILGFVAGRSGTRS